MLPISLTIKGLYSYQKEQTIDFARLTSANIFGIFGNVGSGKSSILEAITFALFGETERMNLRDNRAYNMLNLKSGELFIRFIFHHQNEQYQIVVKGKRNRKNFEKVETTRDAFTMTDGQWKPLEISSIPEIIGLNYENFRRTIIIPQGRFQEFIQLGNTDRSKMMEELFNLGRFELSEKVKAVETKTNNKISNLVGQLAQVGNVNPDDIEKKTDALEAIRKQLELLAAQKIETQKIETELANLQKLFQDIDKQQQIYDNLKNEKPKYIRLENQLKEYEFCKSNFEILIADHKEIRDKIKSLSEEIQKSESKIKELSQKILAEEKTSDSLKKECDQRDQLKQKAEELQKIIDISKFKEELITLQKRAEKGQKCIDEISEEIKTLTVQKEKSASELKKLKNSLQDIAALTEIKAWFDEKNRLTKEISAQNDEIRKLKNSESALAQEQNKLYLTIKPLITLNIDSDSPDKARLMLENLVSDLTIQIGQLENSIEQLNIQNQLEKFVSQLHDGKPCPLCGSPEHPNILDAKNVETELRHAKQQKAEIEKKKATAGKFILECAELILKQQSATEQSDKAGAKLSEIQRGFDLHTSSFKWDNFRGIDEKVISEKIKAYKSQEKLIKQLEEDLEKDSKNSEEKNQRKDKYQKAFNDICTKITERETNVSLLNAQIKLLQFEDEIVRNKEELEKEIQQLSKRFNELPIESERHNKLLSDLKSELAGITGKADINKLRLDESARKSEDIEHRISDKLKESQYQTIDQVTAILSQPLDKEKTRAEIEHFGKNLHAAETQLKESQAKADGKNYDKARHDAVKAEIAQIEDIIKKNNEQSGKISGEIDKLQKDLAESVRLKAELEKLQIRAENIRTLKELFKANGFVNYVSTAHLQELCIAANDRFFKLTGQRLSLELNDKNSFEVRDFMNEGKTRSAKTLSGGQIFQAALCLALALSDNIQKNAGEHSFFFLDEGFGALDKESLAVAFDTLKSLRKEHRIVGIISHVEEMQQEIDCYLKIENEEHSGSRITAVWE
ncbi:MAG: hypothetical protein BWK80_17950 [Desulfobacteraceae bacterium IS3]|nr:MAG: hypothetical protein BWK80_17950 [Desulfobacteraceae bacterium IS3]